MAQLLGVNITALGATAMRARHLIVDGEPKILNDRFAKLLLGLEDQVIRALTAGGADDPTIASAWVLRSRYAEDRLAAALTRGATQYVLLGAGLDSYALREAEAKSELLIFEVDDPSLQQWKRDRIGELNISLPKSVRFAPCDFETTSIRDSLETVGFDRGSPTVVSWLGVTQYLTPAAISETLGWAATLASGSEIVLTYVLPGPTAEKQKAMLAARGMRFETFFTPDAIGDLLAQAGLKDIYHLTPERAQAQYFAGRSDGLVAPESERLVVARSP